MITHLRPEKNIEIRHRQVAVFLEFYRLEHDKDIAVVLLNLSPLTATAAILNVQRVDSVFIRKPIQLGIVRVRNVMPFH